MGIFFMETSYILASIMKTKQNHGLECFATFRETNLIRQALQNEFNKKNLNVCITSEVNSDYFDVYSGIYVKDKDIPITSLIVKYQGYCSLDILKILWNDAFIYHQLQNLNTPMRKDMAFEPMQIDFIIDKILENPRRFYEQVAQELSPQEYQFLLTLIQNRNCQNCTNSDCKTKTYEKMGVDEVGKTMGSECLHWQNDELVGRRKVLVKNG